MLLYYVYSDDTGEEHCNRYWDVRDSQFYNESRPEAVDRLLTRSIKNGLPPWYSIMTKAVMAEERNEWDEFVRDITITARVADENFVYEATFDGAMLREKLKNEELIHYGYTEAVEELIGQALANQKKFPVLNTLSFNDHYDYCMKECRAIEEQGDFKNVTLKAIEERWRYHPTYVCGETEHEMQRHDILSSDTILGLVREDGRVLATVECCLDTIERKPDLNLFSTQFVDRDGEKHILGEKSPLYQHLIKEAKKYIQTYRESLLNKFDRDVEEYTNQLPISTVPNAEAVYDWTDHDFEDHRAMLLSVEDSQETIKLVAIKRLLGAVILKEIDQAFVRPVDFDNSLDPYKYEKLKDRLEQKVVVTDGRLVWEGRNSIDCAPNKLVNPLNAAIVATRIDELYHRGEVHHVTPLQQPVGFDRDFEHELKWGDWQEKKAKGKSR